MVSRVFFHHATSRYSMCHAFRVNRVYGEMLGCSSIRPHEISRSEPLSQSHLLMWFLYNYAEFGFYQQVLPTFCWARGETAGTGPVLRGPEVVPLSVSRFPVACSIQKKFTSEVTKLLGKTVCLATGPDKMRRRGNKVYRHEDLGFIK